MLVVPMCLWKPAHMPLHKNGSRKHTSKEPCSPTSPTTIWITTAISTGTSAKKQLFDRLSTSAFAAVNADDPHAVDMVSDTKAKVVTMAVQGVADERARLVENQIYRARPSSRWSRIVLTTCGRIQCVQPPCCVCRKQNARGRQKCKR